MLESDRWVLRRWAEMAPAANKSATLAHWRLAANDLSLTHRSKGG